MRPVVVEMPHGERDPARPCFLRVGGWNPADPRSRNYARGEVEVGLSVYALDADGQPVVPDHGEWAEDDFRDRMRSAEPKFLVQGEIVGTGHDGEPLIETPVIVGTYPAR